MPCCSLQIRAYSLPVCLGGCSHGKATGLNAQGLYRPAQTAHSHGVQKTPPSPQQLSVGLHCGPLTCWPYPASSAQLHDVPGSPGKALDTTCSHKMPCWLFQPWSTAVSWLATVQHRCFVFGQPLVAVPACQWHAFLFMPNILITPSSHARAGGKEKCSSLQTEAICGVCQGYSEPWESKISGRETHG